MKLVFLVLFVCALQLTAAVKYDTHLDELRRPIDVQWEEFKVKFNRNYGPEEDAMRKEIFAANIAKIVAHNLDYEAGKTTSVSGINQFTDKTHKEIYGTGNPLIPGK